MENSIFWLKNNLFRKKAISQYKTALSNEKLTTEELKQLNWQKRKKIVEYAYNNIAFYKELYDKNNFNPSMLQSEADWIKVPILEKQSIRKNTERLKDPNISKSNLRVTTTGGSTGTPLKVYLDKRFCTEILGWRAFNWWKLSPAAHEGIIHRRVPDTFVSKLKNRLIWWPTRRAYLNASSINNQQLKKFTQELIRKKIVWLQGYVGGLEQIADYVLKNHIKIDRLKLVWSTSAPLYSNVRKKLEKAFACKIMDQYGCCEVANIAIECPYGNNLHINYDFVHVDVVNPQNLPITDQEGDILVTNLESFAYPLIKYKLGDRGTFISNGCPCGNPLPLLAPVKGRISDAVYTPDGTYIDGNYLTTIFDNYPDLFNQFQIYQKHDYSLHIKVKVYKRDMETYSVLKKLKHKLEVNSKKQIPIEIEIVNHIDNDRGKIRYIISEIALAKINQNKI